MTPFQWLSLSCLALVLVWELVMLALGRNPWRIALVRCGVWTTAAVAITRPELLQSLANRIGIRRGADLLIYLLALTFLATTFFFYSRYVRLERQVVQLVRELAILEAKRPRTAIDGAAEGGPPSEPDPT
jgi:small membrane protein